MPWRFARVVRCFNVPLLHHRRFQETRLTEPVFDQQKLVLVGDNERQWLTELTYTLV